MERHQTFKDQQLISLLNLDDHAAFLEIYNRYHSILFAYAFRKLADKQQSKDVVQEVFASLWESRETFILKKHLSGFLYKAVLNKILDIWKHDKVVRTHAETHKQYIDVDSYQTDFLIREKDIAGIIAREISTLPPRMRAVYELKYEQFLSTKEIATELGISEHTVSNQLKNITSRFKKNLPNTILLAIVLISYWKLILAVIANRLSSFFL